jgi:hypothetical protein
LFLVGTVLAAGDNKDSAKSKRAYSLGYGYDPLYYDHDVYHHAPVAAAIHAPVTAYHAPLTAAYHAPVVAHAPVVSAVAAPLAKVTSSVVSTNVHHYPSTYSSYYHAPAPYVSAASYYHAPAAVVAPTYHSPLLSEFHRR